MGLVHLHDAEDALREHIAVAAAPGDAVTVATNEEAREFNARIQAARLERDELDHTRTVTGSDGLDIGAGDVIQARKNDSTLGVANRQTFTVQHVTDDGTVFAVEHGNDRKRQQTVRLPAEYVGEHAHLAYASTAYGVQGTTVDTAHTVLGHGLDGAGTYVGMTRGRGQNTLPIIATDSDDAREQFVHAIERDRADRGLDAATQGAREAVSGIITDGPAAFVNAERERLADAIAHAQQQAGKWERVAVVFQSQRHTHATEREDQAALITAAEEFVRQAREEIVTLLVDTATSDGRAFLTAQQTAWDAERTYQQASRLRRRGAARTRADAHQTRAAIETTVRERWETTPNTSEGLEAWAKNVAQKYADKLPAVVDAEHQAADAHTAANQTAKRHLTEMRNLRERVYGPGGRYPEGGPQRRAEQWNAHADTLRRTLADIEKLPMEQAVKVIRQQHAQAEAKQLAAECARTERAEQFATSDRTSAERPEPQHERGIGY